MLMLALLLSSLLVALLLPVTALKKPPKIPNNKKGLYANYIQSNEWKKKRQERIDIDGGKCSRFHWLPMRKNLHVHHKNYKRLGCENVKIDLETLCCKHHKKEHKK